MRKVYVAIFWILLLCSEALAGIQDISKIEEGANSFANFLVNIFYGPLGATLAIVGAVAVFVESKVSDSKALIFGTVVVLILPFLIAIGIKALYAIGG